MIDSPIYLGKAGVIGLVAGLLSGAFGIGGGMVATPLTRMFLDLSPLTAIGTTLTLIVPTAISGSISYARANMLSWDLAKACLVPCVFGTIFGSFMSSVVNGHILMLLVAILIGVTGVDFAFSILKRFRKEKEPGQPTNKDFTGIAVKRKAAVIAFIVGFLSGLIGVGGGFILVPAFLYTFGISVKEAIGTSLVVVAAVAVPGAVVHALLGHLDGWLALAMIFGSVPGAWVGASIALKVKDSWLKKAFGIVLLTVAFIFAFREGMLILN